MKTLFKLFALYCLLTCDKSAQAQVNQSPALANLDWQGTYKGITPCASCEGIKTALTLQKGNKYLLVTQYMGKSPKADTTKGAFKWKGNNIVLQGIAAGTRPNAFKVEENQVRQLDLKGNPIKGKLAGAYVLQKER